MRPPATAVGTGSAERTACGPARARWGRGGGAGRVALGGVFGYELDLNVLTGEEQAQVRLQIGLHARIEDIVRTGDLYRLASPYEEDPQQPRLASWMHVMPDRRRAVLFAFNRCARAAADAWAMGPDRAPRCLRGPPAPSDYYELVWNQPRVVLRGLDSALYYSLRGEDGVLQFRLPGAVLMSAGVPVVFTRDGSSTFYELVAE